LCCSFTSRDEELDIPEGLDVVKALKHALDHYPRITLESIRSSVIRRKHGTELKGKSLGFTVLSSNNAQATPVTVTLSNSLSRSPKSTLQAANLFSSLTTSNDGNKGFVFSSLTDHFQSEGPRF
jgi:hypothetical protein